MRDFIILLYLHNGERSKNHLKSSSGSLEKERDRERDRETKREEKTSLVVVSRIIIIIIIRKRERERDSYLVTHVWFLLWGQETKFCVVFSMMKRTRKGKKKKESFGESARVRSAVDDDIFGKIDGYYINTGCASSFFLSDSRVLFLSFSLSKGEERNYYAGVTM